MKAAELFDKLRESYLLIKPNRVSVRNYNHLKTVFADTEIAEKDYLHLIKPSIYRETDLALELMFFNSSFIHNVEISPFRVDVITLRTQKVAKVCLTQAYQDKVQLAISAIDYSNNMTDCFYSMDKDRYGELNSIRTNLLNLIK